MQGLEEMIKSWNELPTIVKAIDVVFAASTTAFLIATYRAGEIILNRLNQESEKESEEISEYFKQEAKLMVGLARIKSRKTFYQGISSKTNDLQEISVNYPLNVNHTDKCIL